MFGTGMSKAQLKKQEKAAQLGWQSTNPPKDSLQLQSAVSYLQNCLVALEHEIQNSQKYGLHFRSLAKDQIGRMQAVYDEAHTKIALELLSENEAARRLASEATQEDTARTPDFGESGYQYPVESVESKSAAQVEEFNKDLRQKL